MKRNTIENGAVVKTVVKVMLIYTTTSIIFRAGFFISYVVDFTPHDLLLVELFQTLFAELHYPLYLVVILFVHKSVREGFIQKLKTTLRKWSSLLKKQNNQVSPHGQDPAAANILHIAEQS